MPGEIRAKQVIDIPTKHWTKQAQRGFFSSGKAAELVDTGGISEFCQRSMTEKRPMRCTMFSWYINSYCSQALKAEA